MQSFQAILEPFLKPGPDYLRKAMYSGNEIDQFRKAILLQQGIPFWVQENWGGVPKDQAQVTRDAQAAWVPKWASSGASPFYHVEMSDERKLWELARGRPAPGVPYSDVAHVFSPMSAVDTMRLPMIIPVVALTMANYMADRLFANKDPAIMPADYYNTGILDPVMSFMGPYVQKFIEPSFRSYLDPIGGKIWNQQRLSNEEMIFWEGASMLPGMPQSMIPGQDDNGYYVQNPLTVLMMRLFMPHYGSNIPLAVRTMFDSPAADEGRAAQFWYGFRRFLRLGPEYPYRAQTEIARMRQHQDLMYKHIVDEEEKKVKKPGLRETQRPQTDTGP